MSAIPEIANGVGRNQVVAMAPSPPASPEVHFARGGNPVKEGGRRHFKPTGATSERI